MDELLQTNTQIGLAISDIVQTLSDTIGYVVLQINQELATYIKAVGSVVSYSIVDLIDNIFGFYSDEWPIIEDSMNELNNWINNIGIDESNKIGSILVDFDRITTILLNSFEQQLTVIDNTVSQQYNARMFIIYGQIATFSTAINAPPSYLEEAIQNARSFAMAISCLEGLPYYQFLSDWDYGVEQLLIRIANSVALYRTNPQWIKVDIEEYLIKPIFNIEIVKRREQRELLTSINNRADILEGYLTALANQVSYNKQVVDNLYNYVIEPKLKEIENVFTTWKQDTYRVDMKLINISLDTMFSDIVSALNQAKQILGLLDYGGDLLLRIDKLQFGLRLEQEEKIADVSTRRFREQIPNWLTVVRERIG